MDVDLPEVERVWVDADDLDTLLRTIPSFSQGVPEARPVLLSPREPKSHEIGRWIRISCSESIN